MLWNVWKGESPPQKKFQKRSNFSSTRGDSWGFPLVQRATLYACGCLVMRRSVKWPFFCQSLSTVKQKHFHQEKPFCSVLCLSSSVKMSSSSATSVAFKLIPGRKLIGSPIRLTENESERCSSKWMSEIPDLKSLRSSCISWLHHPHPRIGETSVTSVTEENIELLWWYCKRYFIMRRMDVNKQLHCVFNPTVLSPRWRQHVNQSHTKTVGLLKAINSEPLGCLQCACVCVSVLMVIFPAVMKFKKHAWKRAHLVMSSAFRADGTCGYGDAQMIRWWSTTGDL